MEITAKLSQYRQAPRKVRLVATLLKGMTVENALVELSHRTKRVAPIFHKLVLSAVANAKMQGLDEKTLIVKGIRVDKGPVLKRSRPRAQGRAFPIHKHTSHIVVTLTDGAVADTKTTTTATADTKTVKVAVAKKVVAKKSVTKKKVAATAK
ncbi:MAG: 50S ribosomal protein L22 [Candidatus Lloydbacteria bacterium RIFCSPHIGHO2_01_FULL_49_22]|uniref:Large ribosomal subunit protein uL22 n=1 Tax=Candidatus Lloydbacteria bacterium RIFCSPHIGHO2_01_FULL_49_22 TaxID=1798658 RepID=A0A1G2D0M1_9BACT|nr:MAG: 50S ribosomal protein L22 [Candidatus Lloydbacteria bacterium RIFCSPHIGHO2_01_FULL_49_22]OGZ09379.1 MAG: 50S ribosomal protein L22 [Candidatus Lloydbacteria bacterium RIFCSPHIGHO2_02_FULL_50_18]